MDTPAQTLSDYLNLQAKTSTFVSIDVVGSTTLKAGENEQDIIYTFLAYHKAVSELTYVSHGEVIHIAGDGMMCRFERAEDAAQMSKTLLEAMPSFNKHQNHMSRPVAIRVGVHTGEVLQSQQQSAGQIISQTLDVTAKLQQSAPTNAMRLSEATVNLLKSFPVSKIGWDAKLQINVFEWKGGDSAAPAQRKLPDPVRVLLIEQELDEVIKLKKVLWARHHEAMPVFSPFQATLCVDSWKPHLIIVSLDLPWDAGWDWLREARGDEKLSSVPIIATSTQSNGQTVERALNRGSNGFLRKPLDEQQIVKRAEIALREFYL